MNGLAIKHKLYELSWWQWDMGLMWFFLLVAKVLKFWVYEGGASLPYTVGINMFGFCRLTSCFINHYILFCNFFHYQFLKLSFQ